MSFGTPPNERAGLQLRLSRRADQAYDPRILKAIAIPGYQVPFASREMPMPYG
jgi:alpha-D-ribose 1-methylphosphonate 5-phosphate C-P lyase